MVLPSQSSCTREEGNVCKRPGHGLLVFHAQHRILLTSNSRAMRGSAEKCNASGALDQQDLHHCSGRGSGHRPHQPVAQAEGIPDRGPLHSLSPPLCISPSFLAVAPRLFHLEAGCFVPKQCHRFTRLLFSPFPQVSQGCGGWYAPC